MAAIAFVVGQSYTLIGIDSFMAITTSRKINIVGVHNNMFLYNPVENDSKRATKNLVLKDEMVFIGVDLPFKTDYDATNNGEIDSFSGNSLYNLVGKINIEEVRKFIESNNLNHEIDFGKIVYKDSPVFPELAEEWMLKTSAHG